MMQREDFDPCHSEITSQHMSDPTNLRKHFCFFTEQHSLRAHAIDFSQPLPSGSSVVSPGESASSRSHLYP